MYYSNDIILLLFVKEKYVWYKNNDSTSYIIHCTCFQRNCKKQIVVLNQRSIMTCVQRLKNGINNCSVGDMLVLTKWSAYYRTCPMLFHFLHIFF